MVGSDIEDYEFNKLYSSQTYFDHNLQNQNGCYLLCPSQVVPPTFPLMLGARDEAAEFDEMDSSTSAEMFNDDPR